MKRFYLFIFGLFINCLYLHAQPDCFALLFKKMKKQSTNNVESTHLLEGRIQRQKSLDQDIEIPTLAQDPVRFARFYWGFELAFFDKN